MGGVRKIYALSSVDLLGVFSGIVVQLKVCSVILSVEHKSF